MTKTIFKTLILLLVLMVSSCHKDEEEQTDYSSLFNYDTEIFIKNYSDTMVYLRIVDYKYARQFIIANSNYKLSMSSLKLLNSFIVDMSDCSLSEGRIRYFITAGDEILYCGWIDRIDNKTTVLIYNDDKGNITANKED